MAQLGQVPRDGFGTKEIMDAEEGMPVRFLSDQIARERHRLHKRRTSAPSSWLQNIESLGPQEVRGQLSVVHDVVHRPTTSVTVERRAELRRRIGARARTSEVAALVSDIQRRRRAERAVDPCVQFVVGADWRVSTSPPPRPALLDRRRLAGPKLPRGHFSAVTIPSKRGDSSLRTGVSHIVGIMADGETHEGNERDHGHERALRGRRNASLSSLKTSLPVHQTRGVQAFHTFVPTIRRVEQGAHGAELSGTA